MKIDWKRKLSSRKLWCAAASFATGLVAVLTTDEVIIQAVGLVIQFGTAAFYIFAEASVDKCYGKGKGEES